MHQNNAPNDPSPDPEIIKPDSDQYIRDSALRDLNDSVMTEDLLQREERFINDASPKLLKALSGKKNIPIDKLKWDIKAPKASKGAMMIDLLDHQKYVVELTKSECANIEVIANPQGSQSFNLPQNLRRQKGPNRARKDSYSALVLGNWYAKVFFDAENALVEEKPDHTFIPFAI